MPARKVVVMTRQLKILLACEESQIVLRELVKLGHDAYSCDIQASTGDYPFRHYKMEVEYLLHWDWDAVIAFPPCTHLAASGAKWFEEKQADGRQQEGIDFFMQFTKLDHVPMVAIENPIGIMSSVYRKPDQIIQPHWFGDPHTKTTCLWLKGLPKLMPTKFVDRGDRVVTESGRSLPEWYNLAPSVERSWLRSRTFPGIARAMAYQWFGVAE